MPQAAAFSVCQRPLPQLIHLQNHPATATGLVSQCCDAGVAQGGLQWGWAHQLLYKSGSAKRKCGRRGLRLGSATVG